MQPALPRLTAAALAALLLLAAPRARSEEWRDMPYADMAKMPLVLAKVDAQHVFTTVFTALPGKGQAAMPADFRLQIKVNGQVVPVAVAADGKVAIPVDASSQFGAASFKDVVGFKKALLERREQFARCLVEKLFIHALGRELEI